MKAIDKMIGKYVLIRSYASGVHAGVLEEYDMTTRHVVLKDTRRIWYWEGAFTLSAVAQNGIKEGKLSIQQPELIVTQVEEIALFSPEGEKNIRGFKVHEIN